MRSTVNKNCQRKMLILKNPNSPLFDEAYLILKDDPAIEHARSTDILEEANKLIASRTLSLSEEHRPRRFPFFLYGLLSGGSICTLVYFLFLR